MPGAVLGAGAGAGHEEVPAFAVTAFSGGGGRHGTKATQELVS